jgi:hypothetical protein
MDEAQIVAGEFCLAYLNFSCFDSQLSTSKTQIYAEMSTLKKATERGALVLPGNPGARAVCFWNALRNNNLALSVDLLTHLPRV